MAETVGGRERALALSTVAFTVCLAVWTIFAIIGVRIKANLGLAETEFGLLVGLPILAGSLSRIFLGACNTVALSTAPGNNRDARHAR